MGEPRRGDLVFDPQVADQLHERPVVEALAFGSLPAGTALEVALAQGWEEVFGTADRWSTGDRAGLRQGQGGAHRRDVGQSALGAPVADLGVLAVPAVHGHPPEWHLGIQCLGEQLDGQVEFGGEPDVWWDTGLPTPVRVVGPPLRQVQAVADERVSEIPRVGQHDRDLAILGLVC